MANTIRIKRRLTGATGSPATLKNAELAYNEADAGTGILYYGRGADGNGDATNIVPIGGDGAFVALTGNQTITGVKTITGTLALGSATISGNATFSNNVIVSGDLTVNGTTTTINSTTISVDDKNIELGSIASPSDVTADGGGITLKGTTDKTFNWVDATDAWTSSEHLNLLTGKSFFINGTNVLSSTALGAGVTSSSLTSVGTISGGTWQGTTVGVAYGGTGQSTFTNGQLLIGNTTGNTLSKSTLTAGSGISINNGNGTITIASTGGATFSAGSGLTLNGSVLDANLKINGGIVLETNNFAVDLGASAITGTLAIADGGTGATTASGVRNALDLEVGIDVQAYDADLAALSSMQTGAATALALLTSTEVAILDGALVTTAELNIIDGSTTATATTLAQADRMVVNDNGTMVQVALSDLVTFLEDGATSGFDVNGGTF